MNYQRRLLEEHIMRALKRGKSILLLGPRQTGKTTMLKEACQPDVYYDLALPRVRRHFEIDPSIMVDEINGLSNASIAAKLPLVIIDEIQKVPVILDVVQYLIDNKMAQFILTGSSARKLKRDQENWDINLLPGRVIKMHLDALTLPELPQLHDIEQLLTYGSLPGITSEPNNYKEDDLIAYVDVYLEDEVRREALVRNLGLFSKFVELSAIEAGRQVNLTKLSQEVGVNIHLISEYFQILEDCLIVDKLMPVTETSTRRRLTKSPKYLFFDLGVRRICAREGTKLSTKALGLLFEQFVGMEILRYIRLMRPQARLQYWRDHAGPEVDYVIDVEHQYTPIEVKWSDQVSLADCKNLKKFLKEYDCGPYAYLVCQVPRKRMLDENIIALPWQALPDIKEVLAQ